MFSEQRRDHHWRIALHARRNPAEPIHQPLKHTLLLVMIAVAHTGPAGVPPDLGRYEQEAGREVASVVCFSSVASLCGSRLNSISQQFKL